MSVELQELKQQIQTLQQTVATLQLTTGRFSADDEIAARLRTVERSLAALVNDPTDKSLVKHVRQLNDAVERLQNQMTPDNETRMPRLVSPFIKATMEALLQEIRVVSGAHATGLKTIRGEFASLAASIDGAVAQLTALADRSTELAARRLQDAARSFSTGDVHNADGLKSHGLIESHLLKGR